MGPGFEPGLHRSSFHDLVALMTGPFSRSAHLYDLQYSGLDYESHAATVEGIIWERSPAAGSLLDVACGTGRHLALWRRGFDVEGVDIDSEMPAIAAQRVPGVLLHEGDFTEFDLGRTFDAVTCLFSSIGYAHTEDRLDAAVARMAAHLAPGGVLVVEPWLMPHLIRPPRLRSQVVESDDMLILRSSRLEYDGGEAGGISDLEMAYLVTTLEGSEFFTERHLMGIHTPERYVQAAQRAGLEVEFDPIGTELERGLLIGQRA